MFDNLLKLVQENAGSAIINNAAIPNERNNEVIESTTHSIIDGFKSQLSSGNMNNILDMFNPETAQNAPLNQSISANVVNNLTGRFGLDQSQAGSIAASLIPQVMDRFVNKTNDPSDNSFDLNTILTSIGFPGSGVATGGGGFTPGDLGSFLK